jgi:hypothetical protein
MKVVGICILWVVIVITAFVDPLFGMALAFCGVIVTEEIMKS